MQQVFLKESLISYRMEPFYLEEKYTNKINPTGFRSLNFTKEMFYEHIDKLLFLDEKNPSYENQIGRSLQIDWNLINRIVYHDTYQKKDVPFPPKGTEYEYLVDGKKETTFQKYIRFKIENIHLLLSEMKVGFLVYDIKIIGLYSIHHGEKETLPITLENYEWAMYYLRKLQIAKKGCLCSYIHNQQQVQRRQEFYERRDASLKNNVTFREQEPPEPDLIPLPLKWTDLTNGLLKDLGPLHSFTNQKKIGHHNLLYTSAFVQSPPDIEESEIKRKDFECILANKTYKISHGYRETYYKEISMENILRPFENIMWSLSSEGVSNIVYTLQDEQAMKFFNNSFKKKRETNYYYMYVLALLQKYSLLYFTIESTKMLFQSSIYQGIQLSKEEREEELKRTREFYAETLKFTLHGYYEQVSYHSHYNEIYVELMKALRISELQQELTPKIEAFHQVIESLILEKDTKEKEKQNNIMQTIPFFLLPATLATGILGMNVPAITQSTDFFIGYAVFGITLVTALLYIFVNKDKSIPTKAVIIISAVLFSIIILLDIKYDLPNQGEDMEQLKVEETIPPIHLHQKINRLFLQNR